MKGKAQDLLIILGIYFLAYVVGYGIACFINGIIEKLLIFDIAATIVTFVFSVVLHNSSVYDAYWSLTPMIMSIWLFVTEQAYGFWHMLFLIVFNLWSIRLTINWCIVFTGFDYEDWRYRKYREENSGFMWWVVNFFGIHMMPTLIVFAGMLPLFVLSECSLNAVILPGIAVMLFGISMEFFADRQMHAFLREEHAGICCRRGLWKYSRHPNYLGEISVWFGVFLSMLPFAPQYYLYGLGAVSVAVLFNVVSVPLMEKRQSKRRKDFEDYRAHTSRLLLRPVKK